MKRGGGKAREDLSRLVTEQGNRASAGLDLKSALEVARVINTEDAAIATAVRRALPQIARTIDLIASALKLGGRLIYVGAGTSGRIAALDAAECPPTFNVDPKTVQFVMAGGPAALAAAVEANEDSRSLGEREMAKRNRAGTMSWSELRPAGALRLPSPPSTTPAAREQEWSP